MDSYSYCSIGMKRIICRCISTVFPHKTRSLRKLIILIIIIIIYTQICMHIPSWLHTDRTMNSDSKQPLEAGGKRELHTACKTLRYAISFSSSSSLFAHQQPNNHQPHLIVGREVPNRHHAPSWIVGGVRECGCGGPLIIATQSRAVIKCCVVGGWWFDNQVSECVLRRETM